MAIWEQEPIPEYKQFTEKFLELSEKFGAVIRDIMESPKLDKKTRELVIVNLLGAQKFESGFKFHVKEAMNKGATKEEIIEVLLATYLLRGFIFSQSSLVGEGFRGSMIESSCDLCNIHTRRDINFMSPEIYTQR